MKKTGTTQVTTVYVPCHPLNAFLAKQDSRSPMMVYPFPHHDVVIHLEQKGSDDLGSLDGYTLLVLENDGIVVTPKVFNTNEVLATTVNLLTALQWCAAQEKVL